MSTTLDYDLRRALPLLTKGSRLDVLITLTLHANIRNRCWPSMDTLSDEATNGNRNKATRAKQWLQKHGAFTLVTTGKRADEELKLSPRQHIYQLTGVIKTCTDTTCDCGQTGESYRYLHFINPELNRMTVDTIDSMNGDTFNRMTVDTVSISKEVSTEELKDSATSVAMVDKALFSTPVVTPQNPITANAPAKSKKSKTLELIHFSDVEDLWDSAIGNWKPEAEGRYVYIGKPNTERKQEQGTWTYPFPEKFDDKDWPVDEPERYRNWLKAKQGRAGQIPELKGKILVCDCDDLNSCHGNVLLHAVRYPLIRPRNPIFDLVAMKSFDLKNSEGLDDKTSGRIGQLVKWLKEQNATIDQVSYFYQWYSDKHEDIHPPNNPSSFGPHWHACKQEALELKAQRNGHGAPKNSRTGENPPERKPATPAPVDEFMVYDHQNRYLGMYKDLQAEAQAKGIPYDTHLEQLRAARSAGDGG